MHDWSDKSVDWAGIDAAANFIGNYCRRWGRIGGQTKEKYGTIRFYANFGYLSLHTLIYPGYVYNQFPRWLWALDHDYIGPFLRALIEKPFVKWQMKVYYDAYTKAVQKWPHLRAEILVNADHLDILADRKLAIIIGNKTHVLGWHGEILATWETVTDTIEQ